MVRRSYLVRAALIGAAAGLCGPAFAGNEPAAPAANAEVKAEAEDRNAKLLAALIERRAQVAERVTPGDSTAPGTPGESKAYALKFLDERIASVKARMAK